MGSTILQKMVRIQNGLLLLESFETADFVARQGWTILRGTPAISQDVAKLGLSSFKLDSTRAWIEKVIPSSGLVVVWFYDDNSITTGGFTPFLEVTCSDLDTYGIGVDLAVSTTTYTRTKNGVSTNTFIMRTLGWHRFVIRLDLNFGPTVLSIDGTTVLSDAATPAPITKVRVGCRDNAGTTPFGYFDYVQIYRNQVVEITGPTSSDGQGYSLTKADDLPIYMGVLGAVFTGQLFNDFFTIDGPVSSYFQATKIKSPNPQFVSPVLEVSAGDIWTLLVYDFGRRPTSLDIKPTASRNDVESVSGKNQSSFFNSRERSTLTFNDLTEDKKNELMAFWQRMQKGEVVNIAVDREQAYWTKTTANAAPFSGSVAVLSPITGVVGAAKGSVVNLRAAAGRFRETVTITSTAALTLFVNKIYGEYEIGSQVNSIYYWPFAITTDKALQVTLANLKTKRWTVTLSFKEDL